MRRIALKGYFRDNTVVNVYPVYKTKGTSSTAVLREYGQLHNLKNIMHAGALDPLAEGVLLVVDGVSNVDDIRPLINSHKTYQFSGVLGFTTDTWGILGIIQSLGNFNAFKDLQRKEITEENIARVISSYQGKIEQEVPIFSNMRYRNKRMYQWAREGKAYLVPRLIRERFVYEIRLDSFELVLVADLFEQIISDLSLVTGDFRQEKIIQFLKTVVPPILDRFGKDFTLPVFTITATCEKGTYIRSIVHSIGDRLGFGAVTRSIKRTQVGEYSLDDCDRLE